MTWIRRATQTLTGTGDTLDNVFDKSSKFNQYLVHAIASGLMSLRQHCDNNAGANYAISWSNDGAVPDQTDPSRNDITAFVTDANLDLFQVIEWCNISGEEKLFICHSCEQNGVGATIVPARSETTGKFAVTSGQVAQLDSDNNSSGDYDTDSNASSLGSD